MYVASFFFPLLLLSSQWPFAQSAFTSDEVSEIQ